MKHIIYGIAIGLGVLLGTALFLGMCWVLWKIARFLGMCWVIWEIAR